ncbi:hypothetical protein [Jeotgalicoccus psychrophilus]|nr:hypothetical protein [Jeotgalicoccus psychrophilus]
MLEFDKLIFDGPDVILRTVLIGLMAYTSVIVIIRPAEKDHFRS